MSARYLVPALALAAGVVAQSSCSIGTASTTTISDAAGATAIAAGCKTFTGSIAIATGTTDNIDLSGLSEINGDLVASNVTQITEILSTTLQTITGAFSLNQLTILSTLNFPELTNVDSIEWEALAALQGLSFTNGVQTASTLNIQNTQLNSLDGIDLQVVDTIYIVNNPYLEDINMQLGNITTALTIGSNGNNVSAIFPNLIWANNMTIRNASTVSLPSLEAVNGSLGFYSNEFSMLSAANLTTVGGSLSFVSNADLTNVSMPMLKTVSGGFQIANNTELKIVEGFPKLATIGGAFDLYGNFTNVTLPAISDIRGAFNLQSSADIDSSCSTFKALSGSDGVIKGKFTCAGEQSKPSSDGSSATGTASSSSSSSTSTSKSSASGYLAPGAVTGVMGAIAVFFGLL